MGLLHSSFAMSSTMPSRSKSLFRIQQKCAFLRKDHDRFTSWRVSDSGSSSETIVGLRRGLWFAREFVYGHCSCVAGSIKDVRYVLSVQQNWIRREVRSNPLTHWMSAEYIHILVRQVWQLGRVLWFFIGMEYAYLCGSIARERMFVFVDCVFGT